MAHWLIIGGGESAALPWPNRVKVGATNGGIMLCRERGIVPDLIWLSDPTAISMYADITRDCLRMGAQLVSVAPAMKSLHEHDIGYLVHLCPVKNDTPRNGDADGWCRVRFSGLMLLQWIVLTLNPTRITLAGFDGYGDEWDRKVIKPWLEKAIHSTADRIEWCALAMPRFLLEGISIGQPTR